MFSLGLGLTPVDFRRILAQPRALMVGVVCHFVLLPLVCFLMLKAFGVTGVFAVGFMILAACPTGTTSNLLTYLARGDVALALSFTAIASVITIFTLPVLVTWSLGHFLGESRAVNVPVGLMMGQVAVVLAIPASLGMAVRHRWPQWALGFEPRATRIATGHTADDRAETVLIRLLRGAGPEGLAALPPAAPLPDGASDAARGGAITLIRPLILARRVDVAAHLARHRIAAASDPSNEEPRFLRVRVRRELLPLMEELSPAIVDHLCALAEMLATTPPVEPPLRGLGKAQRLAVARAKKCERDVKLRLSGGREVVVGFSGGEAVLIGEPGDRPAPK